MFFIWLLFSFLTPFPSTTIPLIGYTFYIGLHSGRSGVKGKKNIEMKYDISDISILSDLSDLDWFEWLEWLEKSEGSSLVSILISGLKPPALTC